MRVGLTTQREWPTENSDRTVCFKTVVGLILRSETQKRSFKIISPKHKGFPMTQFHSFWQQKSFERENFSGKFHWKRRSRRVLTIVIYEPQWFIFKKGWVIHSNRGPCECMILNLKGKSDETLVLIFKHFHLNKFN